MKKNCLVCNKELIGARNWLKRAKYCSHSCASKKTLNGFGKNVDNPNWMGGKPTCVECGKGVWWRSKRCQSCARSNENSSVWVGDKVSYPALHTWIRNKLGTPRYCSNCDGKKAKAFDWANISREYKRDVNDFIRLCRSCHKKFDMGSLNL